MKTARNQGEACYQSPEIEVISIDSEVGFAQSSIFDDYGAVPGADRDDAFYF